MADLDLTARETELRKTYKRIVPGSIKQDKATGKLSVVIGCATRGCPNTRRVFTSDLFQIRHCVECTLKLRAARRKNARKQRAKAQKKSKATA